VEAQSSQLPKEGAISAGRREQGFCVHGGRMMGVVVGSVRFFDCRSRRVW
jgi:hypothetical protein